MGMDIRESKNIVNYGFLAFLILVGVASFFIEEQSFVLRMNSLSIPLYIFSVSIILSKSINTIRKTINAEIAKEDSKRVSINDSEKKYSIEALQSSERYILLVKRFFAIDKWTKGINIIAMLSFVLCLLSVSGIIVIGINSIWVNTFSMALVYFDFFVLDEMITRHTRKLIEQIKEEAEVKAREDIENSDS